MAAVPDADILVCQASSCRRAGSQAVLLEIEELSRSLGCRVLPANCLGACDAAPSAVVYQRRRGRERLYTHINNVEKSASMVRAATGAALNLDDPDMLQRLTAARQVRIRQQACDESKWNLALGGLSQQVVQSSGKRRLKLQTELIGLLYKAGLYEEALERAMQDHEAAGASLEATMELAKILGKLGRCDEIDRLESHVRRICCDPEDFRLEIEMLARLGRIKAEATALPAGVPTERRIEGYSIWRLEGVTAVSKHSAVFRLSSKDRLRGTPYPRGQGRTTAPKTWHTTLLAQIGSNSEGPLPWVERDYTPISTAMEWEQGLVDILIKVYSDGLGTPWLRDQPLGSRIWLSQPMKTLEVPSLVADLDQTAFRPASYLLVLAGTGIVLAAQVLQHTERNKCLGGFPTITCPIRLLHSCRSDDVLMTSELADWCRTGALQSWSLLLTEPQAGKSPFPDAEDADLIVAAKLPNASICHSRVSKEHIKKELDMCQKPCRVVISGPAGFNGACKWMLQEVGCEPGAITVLSA